MCKNYRMKTIYKLLSRNLDIGLLVLRIGVGGLMLFHGIYKLVNGIDKIEAQVSSFGLPSFIAYGVYIGEIIAPIMILAGIAARVGGAIVAFNCFVAILIAHHGHLFSLNEVGGWVPELPALFMFGALTLVFTGSGKYAMSDKYLWD